MAINYGFPRLAKESGGTGYFNIIGQQFHKLTVIKRVKATEPRWKKVGFKHVWLCRCECGGLIETVYTALIRERMKACGRRGCYYPHRTSSLCPAYKAIILSHRETSDLSASQIAAIYKTTKNSVIGILDRNGMLNRRPPEVIETRKVVVFPPAGSCLYPHGHPGNQNFHFCGAKAIHGSWCQDHYDLCFIPNIPKMQKQDKIIPVQESM